MNKKRNIVKGCIICLLMTFFIVVPAWPAETSITAEDRIKNLEAQIESLQAENESLKEELENSKDWKKRYKKLKKKYDKLVSGTENGVETTSEAKSVNTPTPVPTATLEPPLITEAQETTSQTNALREAKSYLGYSAFSYTGLIEQLEFSGYPHEDAVYAADNCGADWMEQAVKEAKSYLNYSSFSLDGLIEQLEYSGFTHEEAVHGANTAYNENSSSESGVTPGMKNALKEAQSYLNFTAFSYSGLIEQLEFSGYSHDEAVYAADNCGADWYEQAAKSAANYLEFMPFSHSGLVEQLEYSGFTNEQAEYGATANGY